MPTRPFIVVIGSINTDLIVPIPRLPKPGETLAGGELVTAFGGKGANQAVAAARLGADVAMVGRVGRDDFGDRRRVALAKEGVDVRHVRRTPAPTGTAIILLQSGGENSIVLSPGANAHVTPADVDAALPVLRRADAVLLQLEIPIATVRHALRRCRELGVTTVLDPAPAPAGPATASVSMKATGPAKAAGPAASRPPKSFVKTKSVVKTKWAFAADVLTPNQTEAGALLGRATSPDATAAALIAAGATNVVLKLGDNGSLHADATGVYTHVAAFAVDPVDTTAAGDAFTAALAVARAEGRAWPDALRFANAAGALACTTLGAQPSLPKRRQVDRLR